MDIQGIEIHNRSTVLSVTKKSSYQAPAVDLSIRKNGQVMEIYLTQKQMIELLDFLVYEVSNDKKEESSS